MVYALDNPRTVKAVPLNDICESWLQPLEDEGAANEDDKTKRSRVRDVFPTHFTPSQQGPPERLEQGRQWIQKIEGPKLRGNSRGPISNRAGVQPKLNNHRNHILHIAIDHHQRRGG